MIAPAMKPFRAEDEPEQPESGETRQEAAQRENHRRRRGILRPESSGRLYACGHDAPPGPHRDRGHRRPGAAGLAGARDGRREHRERHGGRRLVGRGRRPGRCRCCDSSRDRPAGPRSSPPTRRRAARWRPSSPARPSARSRRSRCWCPNRRKPRTSDRDVPAVGTAGALAALVAETFFFGISVAIYVILGAAALLIAYPVDTAMRTAGLAALGGMTGVLVVAAWMAWRKPTVAGALVVAGFPCRRIADSPIAVRAFERTAYRIDRPSRRAHRRGRRRRDGLPRPQLSRDVAHAVADHRQSHVAAAFILDTVGRLTNVVFKMVPLQLGVLQVGSELVARAHRPRARHRRDGVAGEDGARAGVVGGGTGTAGCETTTELADQRV